MKFTSEESKTLLAAIQKSPLPEEDAKKFSNLVRKLEKNIIQREKIEFRQVDKKTKDEFRCWIFTEHFDPVAALDLYLMWPEFDPASPHRLVSSTKAITHCLLERKKDGEIFYGCSLCDSRDVFEAHKGEQRALGIAKKAVHYDAPVTSYMVLPKTDNGVAVSLKDMKTSKDKNAFFHKWIKLTRTDRNKMITITN